MTDNENSETKYNFEGYHYLEKSLESPDISKNLVLAYGLVSSNSISYKPRIFHGYSLSHETILLFRAYLLGNQPLILKMDTKNRL